MPPHQRQLEGPFGYLGSFRGPRGQHLPPRRGRGLTTTLRARHGDPQEALRRFPELFDLWERAVNWTQQWIMLRSLVATLVRLGRDQPAAVL